MKLLLGILAAVLSAGMISAFVPNYNAAGQAARWHLENPHFTHTNVVNRQTKAVRYFIGPVYSTTNAVAERNAVRAAFDQWQAIPGTLLKFEEAGLLEGAVDVNPADDTNVVYWSRSTVVNGGFDNIRGLVAVTFFETFSDNSMAEADIVLNAADYRWFTDFNAPVANMRFAEATLLHEIGHMIGLHHSPLGAATMLARGESGIDTQAGLSRDEVSAAIFLYGRPETVAQHGTISGRVTLNNQGLLGAVVIAEDLDGNAAGAAVSDGSGAYRLPALPPGRYQVRATPLDSRAASVNSRLLTGADIHRSFESAQTEFLPSQPSEVQVHPGGVVTLNFNTQAGNTAFRITRFLHPTANLSPVVLRNVPMMVRPGQRDVYIGVLSPNLPEAGATLSVTGGGITLGPTEHHPGAVIGFNLLAARIEVSSEAVPGIRSLVVRRGDDVAWANGFLEVLPRVPDHNFDGLDDRFQRKFFPLFTAPEANPGADPDGDGFNNFEEYISGTHPLESASFLEIQSIRRDLAGATLRWKSAADCRYQVWRRHRFGDGAWEQLGPVVIATGPETEFLDPGATHAQHFYRIQAVP